MRKRILVLDDDKDILDVISYILIKSGYEIFTLESGEALFHHVQHFRPRPTWTGGHFARRLKAETKRARHR